MNGFKKPIMPTVNGKKYIFFKDFCENIENLYSTEVPAIVITDLIEKMSEMLQTNKPHEDYLCCLLMKESDRQLSFSHRINKFSNVSEDLEGEACTIIKEIRQANPGQFLLVGSIEYEEGFYCFIYPSDYSELKENIKWCRNRLGRK